MEERLSDERLTDKRINKVTKGLIVGRITARRLTDEKGKWQEG